MHTSGQALADPLHEGGLLRAGEQELAVFLAAFFDGCLEMAEQPGRVAAWGAGTRPSLANHYRRDAA